MATAMASALVGRASGEAPQLRIMPDRGGGTRHMPLGHTFALTCTLSAPGHNATIWWENDQGSAIYGEARASSIYSSVLSSENGAPAVSLVFNKAAGVDQGQYHCFGKDATGADLTPASVNITLFEPARYEDKRKVVAAIVNQTVQINCNADGDPPPQIRIRLKGVDTMPANYITRGSVLNVENLTAADHNRTVMCVAMQVFRDEGTTHMTMRNVLIQVYTNPVLNTSAALVHAIVGRPVALRCHAVSAFPPIVQFIFYRDGGAAIGRADRKPKQYEMGGAAAANTKYSMQTNWRKNWADLKIAKLDDSDLGDYTCMAKTLKTSAQMIIKVVRAAPPARPTAAFLRSDGTSVTWRLGVPAQFAAADVPLVPLPDPVGYHARYLPAEFVDDLSDALAGAHMPLNADTEYNKQLWKHGADKRFLPIDPSGWLNADESGEYVLSGLRPDVDYVFRFKAASVAGTGEEIEIAAKTAVTNS